MQWLSSLEAETLEAINDGGLALVAVGQENEAYFEIGGTPETEER